MRNLETPNKCDNWRGSVMANATRDPLFWAAVAVAEQDFDGAGDLCIRCHSPSGWLRGRSMPTDGSLLQPADANGVEGDAGTTRTGCYGSGAFDVGVDLESPVSNQVSATAG